MRNNNNINNGSGSGSGNNNNNNSDYVPPLHRREGHGNVVLYQQQQNQQPQGEESEIMNSDPDATEFLSRILLLLGSFVILCLLLF